MKVDYCAMDVSDLDSVVAVEMLAHEAPWTRGNFFDSLRSGHFAMLMRKEQDLIGYGIFMKLPDEAELLNITIAPPWQKQGLGKQLLDELCTVAKKAGAERMYLEVRASNIAACTLYTRNGFTQIGARRGYYACSDGRREDALLMARTL